MLDEGFRRRVSDLADSDEGGLDDAARERVLAFIRSEGPGIVQRSKRQRWFAIAGGLAVAAAAAIAAVPVLRHSLHPEEKRDAQSGAVAGGPVLACSGRAVSASAKDGFVEGASGARLDLGAVAVASTAPGAHVRLEEASPCRTFIALESGTVAVHAKDLGGGELRVRTVHGDVVVHGTVFAVTEDGSSLAVEVVVGNVSVTERDDVHTVTTGQRLLVSKVGAAQGPLTDERAHELRTMLGIPEAVGLQELPAAKTATSPTASPVTQTPAVTSHAAAPVAHAEPEKGASHAVPDVSLDTEETPAVAPPPQDPLALAERARRAGDYTQARDLYRRAAEGSSVTAEAAWVALARMELSLGHAGQALAATKRRQERFGRGTLGPEALWIDVRCYRQMGDIGKARDLASQLVEHWPSSPQARAAEQWLSAR